MIFSCESSWRWSSSSLWITRRSSSGLASWLIFSANEMIPTAVSGSFSVLVTEGSSAVSSPRFSDDECSSSKFGVLASSSTATKSGLVPFRSSSDSDRILSPLSSLHSASMDLSRIFSPASFPFWRSSSWLLSSTFWFTALIDWLSASLGSSFIWLSNSSSIFSVSLELVYPISCRMESSNAWVSCSILASDGALSPKFRVTGSFSAATWSSPDWSCTFSSDTALFSFLILPSLDSVSA